MAASAQKRCSKCNETKPVSAFHKNRGNLDGLCCRCKLCARAARIVSYAKNREACLRRGREYHKKHRDRAVTYWQTHREAYREYGREYYSRHKRKRLAEGQAYREANREEIRQKSHSAASRQYYRERHQKQKCNPQYRLARALRSRLYAAIKSQAKCGSAVYDLGCSVPDLVAHLSQQFLPGMTWANHGKWHVDHIQPLALFDLAEPKQLKQACHFTNLQPLWAVDNIRKGARINEVA